MNSTPKVQFLEGIIREFNEDRGHSFSELNYAADLDQLRSKCSTCKWVIKISGAELAMLKSVKQLTDLEMVLNGEVPKKCGPQYLQAKTLSTNSNLTPNETPAKGIFTKIPPEAQQSQHPISTEEIELDDQILEHLEQWLNFLPRKFDPLSRYWFQEIPVFTSNKLAHATGEQLDISLNPAFTKILIRRVHCVMPLDRYWVEFAVRQDTHEPILTVNHKGSYIIWKEEQL